MRIANKKIAAVAAGAIVVASAGAAYAYWTTTGAGSGSATTAAAAQGITVHQTSAPVVLTPGGAEQTLSGNFSNPNTGSIKVTQVSVTFAGTTWQTGCSADDYTLVQPAAQTEANEIVSSGSNVGAWTGGSVKLDNLAGDQDGCKGQALVLTYSAL